jgi:hypothetical protein
LKMIRIFPSSPSIVSSPFHFAAFRCISLHHALTCRTFMLKLRVGIVDSSLLPSTCYHHESGGDSACHAKAMA